MHAYGVAMTKRRWTVHLSRCVAWMILVAGTCSAQSEKKGETDWPAYGNDPGGIRYSPLRQMDPANVGKLRVAWTFHTKDVSDGNNGLKRSGFETTPIL